MTKIIYLSDEHCDFTSKSLDGGTTKTTVTAVMVVFLWVTKSKNRNY
jgi:hypothetical protein